MMYMEQNLSFEQIQDQKNRELGDLFAEFLEQKGKRDEFEKMSALVMVSVDGEILHTEINGKLSLLRLSDPQVQKIRISPQQQVRFLPAVAGG